jgi:hypothetical protein
VSVRQGHLRGLAVVIEARSTTTVGIMEYMVALAGCREIRDFSAEHLRKCRGRALYTCESNVRVCGCDCALTLRLATSKEDRPCVIVDEVTGESSGTLVRQVVAAMRRRFLTWLDTSLTYKYSKSDGALTASRTWQALFVNVPVRESLD